MSLGKPTPGELADRIGILQRKIVEGGWEGKPVDHWESEQADLWGRLQWALIGADFWILFVKLFGVNAALWESENDIRRTETEATMAMLAKKIAALNDQRASLIHQINQLFDPEAAREKLH
jgi:hypothetical protein